MSTNVMSLSFIKSALLFCIAFIAMFLIIMGYICPGRICAIDVWSSNRYSALPELDYVNHQQLTLRIKNDPSNRISFNQIFTDSNFNFNLSKNDVMVFLHIQKTAGTSFGRHLVRDLKLEAPCLCEKGKKRCKCLRPHSKSSNWLFSRYTTGWACGLHADWTELTSCVENVWSSQDNPRQSLRFFYVTILRDPISRFLSEYNHIQRGATWKNSFHQCNGRSPNAQELPLCYKGANWRNVSLQRFMSCPFNLAINRQTRMLADLTLVGCYNRSAMSEAKRNELLLASAKDNLREMAFFGISEEQKMSQYVFEQTFKLQFSRSFIQLNETHSSLALDELSPKMVERIRSLNFLDIQLYEYAKSILRERFQKLSSQDEEYDSNIKRINDPDLSVPDKMSPEFRLPKKLAEIRKKNRSESGG